MLLLRSRCFRRCQRSLHQVATAPPPLAPFVGIAWSVVKVTLERNKNAQVPQLQSGPRFWRKRVRDT